MRVRHLWPVVAAAACFAITQTSAQAPASFSTLNMRVPVPPRPLVAGGRTHFAYELHIANMSARAVSLDRVEVRERSAGAGTPPLLRLEADALGAAIRKFGSPPDDKERRLIAGGQSAVLFVWITLESHELPRTLTHRVELQGPVSEKETGTVSVEGIEVAVSSQLPRIIGPPLEGDHWLAANGPDNATGHRRTLLSLSGEAHIAQRFAIDWVRLHDDGRTYRGDPLLNTSYRAFGASALAVANGTVIEALDEIPENVPDPVARAVPITPRTLVGNYVLLDIGDGAWAVYAHLQRGSVRVKQGDKVRRGQVLGLVGNTGNSTEPHLHFHVADRARSIDSEGIPYRIARFGLEAEPADVTQAFRTAGQSVEVDRVKLAEWLARPPATRRDDLPMLNALVAFVRD